MDSRRTASALVRLLVAGAVAVALMVGVLVLLLIAETGRVETTDDRALLLLNVAVTSVVGAVAFVVAAWAMRVREVSAVLSYAGRLARRGRR
jgi:hypothetical protein